jgi:hypothetical protein
MKNIVRKAFFRRKVYDIGYASENTGFDLFGKPIRAESLAIGRATFPTRICIDGCHLAVTKVYIPMLYCILAVKIR